MPLVGYASRKVQVAVELNQSGHVRIGWGQVQVDMDLPCHCEHWSYSYRDIEGTAFNNANECSGACAAGRYSDGDTAAGPAADDCIECDAGRYGAAGSSTSVRVHQGGTRWQTQLLAQQETIAFSVLKGSTSQPVEAIKLRIASFATRVDTAQQVVLHPSAQVSVRLADTRCPTQARVRVKTTVSV